MNTGIIYWLFDRNKNHWYQRDAPTVISKRYPGKPYSEESATGTQNHDNDESSDDEGHEDDKSVEEQSADPTKTATSTSSITPTKRNRSTGFYVADKKWIRIVIARLGRLRGTIGFGNARAVRNLFDLCCKRQSNRLADLKRAGYHPDIHLFTRDDLLGPSITDFDTFRKECSAYQSLMAMEGLKEVKHAIDLLIKLVIFNVEREEQREEKPLEVSLNRIFLGNPGTGKTTVAKLYGEILKSLGLLSKGEVLYKTCSDFIGNALGRSEEITRGILEQAQGCVLVIDEAYGLYSATGGDGGNEPYREAVINTMVEVIQGKPGEDRAVLMLGYKEEMEKMLNKCNPGLSRRFQMENAFYFYDYDDEALLSILTKRINNEGMAISEEAATFAIKQLAKARARPHFGNAGAVNNLLSDAKLRMQQRLSSPNFVVKTPQDYCCLEKFDFMPENYSDEIISEEKLLSTLVGNKQIKEKLKRYRALVEMKRRQGKDVKTILPFNYIFTGSPGTGKTTVARLMGKMLYSLGVIPSEEVIEKSASDFMTGFVGQSGKQTREIFQQALGRVLFIDEAYQLNPAVGGSYMSEVVDEIVKLLTSAEYKSKLVVILAGYAKDIDDMLAVNPGLRSRFTERVHFMDFDAETVCDMLTTSIERELQAEAIAMMGASHHVSTAAASSHSPSLMAFDVKQHLKVIANRLITLSGFANGRDCETFLAKLEIARACQFTDSGSDEVTIATLEEAFRELATLKQDNCTVSSAANASHVTKKHQQEQQAFQTHTRPAPPPPMITTTSSAATSVEEEVFKAEEEMKVQEELANGLKNHDEGKNDQKKAFLVKLQSTLDRLGLNSAQGVERLSTLDPNHPEILAIAHDIARSCGFDLKTVKAMLAEWSSDQETVRDLLRQQKEEEAQAKAQGRAVAVPIWRCGVCGRADLPYIACYVQPFIVRYERRQLNQ
jgi:SpoVK/Ycf46/Vps4 family AAA+-type ATPase